MSSTSEPSDSIPTTPARRDIRIVYASAASKTFQPKDLVADILVVAGPNNTKLGITGMLLHVDGSFFQVLEGEESAVHALYEKILRDPRHTSAIKLIEEPIERRAFSRWSMGYARVTRTELAQIEGLNDFFGQGSSFRELEAGRAKSLLLAFREGNWRRRLS